MIEIRNISKSYGPVKALDNVSLSVPRGSVVGLLGPNGAGKTTLFKLIAGIIQPDQGQILPRSASWPTIGYKQERLLFPNHLSLRSYLQVVARISNIPPGVERTAVDQSLATVGLLSEANKRIRTCSKGMRQRLALAQVLIGGPNLLLLDEPSNGLDPTGQQEIQKVITALRDEGKTIIISSHQLAEVTQVCSMLVILNNGRIHYQKNMAEALSVPQYIRIDLDQAIAPLQPQLQQIHQAIEVTGNQIRIYPEAMPLRREVMALLVASGYDVVHVEHHTQSLAEIYAEVVT